MKVLAVIPARGGSKGIPRKNIKMLAGKPLIAWTICAAIDSGVVDKLVVSTDDEEISSVAHSWGAEIPVLRPAKLAQDETPSMDVVLHIAEQTQGFEWLLLLQPTSPLRSADDIRNIVNIALEHRASSVVSVCKSSASPAWMYRLNDSGQLRSILQRDNHLNRRQDICPTYQLNGALYLMRREWLMTNKKFIDDDTIAYLMPPERSADIDTQLDWDWTEFLIGKRNG